MTSGYMIVIKVSNQTICKSAVRKPIHQFYTLLQQAPGPCTSMQIQVQGHTPITTLTL